MMMAVWLSLVSALVVVGSMPSPAAAAVDSFGRPFIFGSGYIYGSWKQAYAGNSGKQHGWDEASLDMLVKAGARSTGLSFNWVDIEAERGVYNWSTTDYLVNATVARGLTGFAYTGNTPDWALPPSLRGKGLGYRFPPAANETAAFSAFFTALATRYKASSPQVA